METVKQIKPMVNLSDIENNSVSSIIANVSEALREQNRISDIREMTIKCMELDDYVKCIEYVKKYVVIV